MVVSRAAGPPRNLTSPKSSPLDFLKLDFLSPALAVHFWKGSHEGAKLFALRVSRSANLGALVRELPMAWAQPTCRAGSRGLGSTCPALRLVGGGLHQPAWPGGVEAAGCRVLPEASLAQGVPRAPRGDCTRDHRVCPLRPLSFPPPSSKIALEKIRKEEEKAARGGGGGGRGGGRRRRRGPGASGRFPRPRRAAVNGGVS